MSISELVELGFSRTQLSIYSHDPRAPTIWSPGKGKVWFDTSKFDEYLKMRNDTSNQQGSSKQRVPWSQRKSHLLQQVTKTN